MIEVLGWFLYVVPVLALSLWPRAWRPAPAARPRVRAGVAAVPRRRRSGARDRRPDRRRRTCPVDRPGQRRRQLRLGRGPRASARPADGRDRTGQEARVDLPASAHRRVTRAGRDRRPVARPPARGRRPGERRRPPSTLTLDDLVGLFGRVPVGISPSTNPGPFRGPLVPSRRPSPSGRSVVGSWTRPARNASVLTLTRWGPPVRAHHDARPHRLVAVPDARVAAVGHRGGRGRDPRQPNCCSGAPGCRSPSASPPRRSAPSPSVTVAAGDTPPPPPPNPSPPAARPPGTRQGAPTMPFGKQTVRPLITLGALGAVTALALTGCAANSSSADGRRLRLREQGRPRRRSR